MEIIGLFGELKLWDQFCMSQDVFVYSQGLYRHGLHNKNNYSTDLLFYYVSSHTTDC